MLYWEHYGASDSASFYKHVGLVAYSRSTITISQASDSNVPSFKYVALVRYAFGIWYSYAMFLVYGTDMLYFRYIVLICLRFMVRTE